MPKGYIKTTPRGMLSWADVRRILGKFTYLWIATTGETGHPHLVQQWGVWVEDALWFEGSGRTRWARDLARDPHVAFGVSIEHRAAYGEGLVEIVRGAAPKTASAIAKAYSAKYGRTFKYRPKADQYEEGPVFRARPTKLIAFDVKRFNTSAARFTFAEG